jgi:hypothetical protein
MEEVKGNKYCKRTLQSVFKSRTQRTTFPFPTLITFRPALKSSGRKKRNFSFLLFGPDCQVGKILLFRRRQAADRKERGDRKGTSALTDYVLETRETEYLIS